MNDFYSNMDVDMHNLFGDLEMDRQQELDRVWKLSHCTNCGSELTPAPAKLRADGEQTYCGYIPCPCDRPIMTDCGLVYPGEEYHAELLKSKKYSIHDIR